MREQKMKYQHSNIRAAFFLFIIFYFVINSIIRAEGWQWQKPYPQGNALKSISFVATVANRGFAVGDLGTVIFTPDGGTTWENIDIGTIENLNSVYMHDDIMIFIAGDNGKVYFLFDEDSTIVVTEQLSGTTEDLHSITSHTNGCTWIAGDNRTVLRSTDLGVTWTNRNPPFSFHYNSLHNIECTTAWAVGLDGYVVTSTDWGISWTYIPTPTDHHLFAIDIGTFQHIRAVGNAGTMILTTDSGATWTVETTGTTQTLYDVYNIGFARSYAVGTQGTILESTDVGAAWEQRNSGTISTLYDVEGIFGSDEMYVAGHYGNVLKNSGVGTDFELMTGETKYFLGGIEFVGKDTGWVVGGERGYGSDGIIMKTSDSGQTWDEQLTSYNLWNLDFVNAIRGYAVGEDGEILVTNSGGTGWMAQTSPVNSDLYAVSFVDENKGWISGRYGEILHTTNGGITWVKQTNIDMNPLWGIHFVNEYKGWACGLDSTILHTADGGVNWGRQTLTVSEGATLFDIFFINEMRGFAVGSDGVIYRTIDGSQTWYDVESGTDETLLSIYFIDIDNGWISGDAGTVLKTTDGGATWNPQFSGVATNGLLGIYFSDLHNGWAVGEGGTIISTNDGGGPITDIKDEQVEIPSQFLLSQNYPNPFNPTTKIKFTIPTSPFNPSPYQGEGNRERFITLKIYDILGNEIATLVNEQKSPGSYEVEFNSTGLSSGVYFYRITAGKFSETKKMILMK
jgi:photosystem II stability/assembly factor-like uncharacterized protein